LMEILDVKSLMKDQLRALEKASHLSPIKWTTFALPRQYHPRSFFNSLETTSELYQPPEINKVLLPHSLSNYATQPDKIVGELFDYNYLISFLKYFSVFDITATNPLQDAEGFTWGVVRHEYSGEKPKPVGRRTSQQSHDACSEIGHLSPLIESLSGQTDSLPKPKVIYREQCAELSRATSELSQKSRDVSQGLNEPPKIEGQLNRHNEDLGWALYRSVSNINSVV